MLENKLFQVKVDGVEEGLAGLTDIKAKSSS
jgi:hypothetical protein